MTNGRMTVRRTLISGEVVRPTSEEKVAPVMEALCQVRVVHDAGFIEILVIFVGKDDL